MVKGNTGDFSPAGKPSNVSFCSTLLLPKMPGTEMLEKSRPSSLAFAVSFGQQKFSVPQGNKYSSITGRFATCD